MPTTFEVIGWIVLLALIVSTLLGLMYFSNPGDQVEDLAAWQRNYERMQRR